MRASSSPSPRVNASSRRIRFNNGPMRIPPPQRAAVPTAFRHRHAATGDVSVEGRGYIQSFPAVQLQLASARLLVGSHLVAFIALIALVGLIARDSSHQA